jgi:cell division protein FtsN
MLNCLIKPFNPATFSRLKPCIAKDYAKKKKGSKKKGASRGKKESASLGLIFTTFILVVGLIALLVYLKWYQPEHETSTSNQKTEESKPTKSTKKVNHKKTVATKKIVKEAEEIPFYQSHEDMINKTVDIPAEDLELPDSSKYQYLMPCGSFRDLKRADELKAQIAFAGYESKINSVNVKSGKSLGLWYRVELGPYKSKRQAESIRHRLQDNGLNYCKIWPKKIK